MNPFFRVDKDSPGNVSTPLIVPEVIDIPSPSGVSLAFRDEYVSSWGIIRLISYSGCPNSPSPPTPCQCLPVLIDQRARFADILDGVRIRYVNRFVVVKGRTAREAYLLDIYCGVSRDWSRESVLAERYRQRVRWDPLPKSVAHPVAKAPGGFRGLLSSRSHVVETAKKIVDSQGAMSSTRFHVHGEDLVRFPRIAGCASSGELSFPSGIYLPRSLALTKGQVERKVDMVCSIGVVSRSRSTC